ncbi:kinase-like domain-containing protein [Gongronella butleri]|nr:kinase-like domain-containing protein [Gongronella butleri]
MTKDTVPIPIPHLPHLRLSNDHHGASHAPAGLAATGVAGSDAFLLHHVATSIDDYEIKGVIGYGSSAIVYSAVYTPMQMPVAIKMVELDMYEQKQIDEVRRETTLMALSHHDNVLPVYTSFVSKSKLCIVTKYLSEGSCIDIIRTAYPDGLEEIAIATILKQTLEGLAYLHRNGHIHRDIKAGNLLVDQDGTILLGDFGVSSSLMENVDRGTRRTFVGTPCWMAPEVMEQKGQDYKVDIWSFGITAIELATGQAPYAKLPPLKVLLMTLSNDPPTLPRETAAHKYSKMFRDMVDLCLNKDPGDRPSAERLLAHPFFKQAKKKDYLVKMILTGLPPLEQRPRKKILQQHMALMTPTDEYWDFDFGDQQQQQQEEELDGEAMALSSSSSSPPKRRITFGQVVVRNPSLSHDMKKDNATTGEPLIKSVSADGGQRKRADSASTGTVAVAMTRSLSHHESTRKVGRFELSTAPAAATPPPAVVSTSTTTTSTMMMGVSQRDSTSSSTRTSMDHASLSISSSSSPPASGTGSVSASNSMSRLCDPVTVYTNLDELLRHNESQRMLLDDMMLSMQKEDPFVMMAALEKQLEKVEKENEQLVHENALLKKELEALQFMQ